MQVFQFPCPHCAARLRLRDKSFAGRTVVCPDCRQPVQMVAAADGSLTGRVPEVLTAPESSHKSTPPSAAADVQPPAEERTDAPASSARWNWRSPAAAALGLAVTVAITIVAVVVVAAIRNAGDNGGRITSAAANESAGDGHPPGVAAPLDVATPADTVDSRMKQLGDWMSRHVDEHGAYPPGTVAGSELPVDQRLSWMAVLVAEQAADGNVRPAWDRPWQDPLNDRFVRRRIEAFQNPALATFVGQDGYPAGHFAGMAGVGADAAELPLHHGRAGIFGFHRTTRVEDVRDGTANTILVVGVQSTLGSWAAGGAATVRALAHEPYFNGPDGFGTGQPDGMSVLMADGSVRFLSRETDPVILRRMAAMADGLPLDRDVPGEPDSAGLIPPPLAGVPPVPPNAGVNAARPGPEQTPIDVPLASDVPIIDVEAALGQRIASIDQPEPVPASKLLQQIAEMAGVTIDARSVLDDPELAERLNAPVTLNLSDTTVRDILQAVLDQARLRFETGAFGIRVSATESEGP